MIDAQARAATYASVRHVGICTLQCTAFGKYFMH
jgi:hypothetical protein